MTTRQTITLPWPPAALSPNARHGHWGSHYKARKKYKDNCLKEMLAQKIKRMDADELRVRITFHPPDKRLRNKDNMIASFKYGQDAVANAVGVPDEYWGGIHDEYLGNVVHDLGLPERPHGKVIIELEAVE